MKLITLPLLLIFSLCSFAQLTRFQNDSILFRKANVLYETKKYDEALTIVNELIDANNTNIDYYELRGNIYFKKRYADSALFNFTAMILLAPEEPWGYAHRADVLLGLQMPNESIEDYNQAIKFSKSDTLRYAIIFNRGNARSIKRDFQGAYEDYKLALDFDSTQIGAMIMLGSVLDDLGRIDEAVMYLEKAIRLAPNEIGAIGNLGFRYMDIGNYKGAIKQFNRVLELSPDEPLAYNNRGYAKYKMNDLKGAMKDIERSIALYPQNSYAYRNRALVYLAMNQTARACEDLQRAVNLGYTPMYGDDVQQLIEKHCLIR